jgi:hypothetical protein
MATRPTPRPSAAPAASPRPQARPANFDQIVASQSGGNDSPAAAAAVASSPAVQQGLASVFGGGGGSQGSGGGFNPFNFGVIGIARALLSAMNNGNDGPSGMRPQQRPSIMQRGDEMVATRDMPRFGFSAGDTAATPEFSPFSFRGFTSTDPGNVMRNIMGAERNMAAMPMDSGGDGTQPTAPVVPATTPAAPSTAMPGTKPAWWPAGLPWPPAPSAPYTPTPMQATVPYQRSYSSVQDAIFGATNPLMLGIGGMVRRR